MHLKIHFFQSPPLGIFVPLRERLRPQSWMPLTLASVDHTETLGAAALKSFHFLATGDIQTSQGNESAAPGRSDFS